MNDSKGERRTSKNGDTVSKERKNSNNKIKKSGLKGIRRGVGGCRGEKKEGRGKLDETWSLLGLDRKRREKDETPKDRHRKATVGA